MSFCILGKYTVAKFNNTLFLDYYTGWDGERYSIIKVILTLKVIYFVAYNVGWMAFEKMSKSVYVNRRVVRLIVPKNINIKFEIILIIKWDTKNE